MGEGALFSSRSYVHIMFNTFSELVYWYHEALQIPFIAASPRLKECASEINHLSFFPFHLTSSPQPSMWMVKTCKRLEEMRKRRGRGSKQSKSALLLLPPGVQQTALFPSSLHPNFIPLFLFFLLQASASQSQMCKCYRTPSALKELHFAQCQV